MLTPEQCWKAICDRDASHDGEFVFAVSSTGIYCRPSCPARRPKREHVSFYPTPEAAVAAGYRPCKRCSPQGQSPAQQLDTMVQAACDLLSQQPLTLDQLATRIGFSASHLSRAFKARTGMTPHAWAKAHEREKMDRTAMLSNTGNGRKQALPEQIRYAIADCTLGLTLMACSEKGVCAVLFADSPDALEHELHQRFPTARLEQDDHGLKDLLGELLRQIREPQRAAHLPLDIRGTAFQQQIWNKLREIPSGQTRTYAQLATEVGSHPRAVARACASNPLGLIVPCHRVIASNGNLSGYRWGLARKQAILDQEKQATATAPTVDI
ncbi:methylated-DNA--[protein]-cysteine S-methyltransferase [Ectopseudomonas mendocina]|uniref:Methylated-DNA--[protein]-cysteine S-methyltransferase n=1 Tax=Ectopseudomonas mendocina TaxID=300 RepID=A0ABZ2RFE0_ECTME